MMFNPIIPTNVRISRGLVSYSCRDLKNPIRCKRCKHGKYCNIQCQETAWDLHKSECIRSDKVRRTGMVEKQQSKILFYTRLLRKLRIEAKRRAQPDDDVFIIRSIDDLRSILDFNRLNNEKRAEGEKILRLLLQFYTPKQIVKAERFYDLYARVICNAALIYGSDNKTALGSGLYLRASMINHSCDYNCVVSFDGTTMRVSSAAHKNIREGEECTFSYIPDVKIPTEERRRKLMEDYYFHCTCRLCSENDRI